MNEKFLKNLNKKQYEEIHNSAIKILSDTGVVFQSKEACEILEKGGAKTVT